MVRDALEGGGGFSVFSCYCASFELEAAAVYDRDAEINPRFASERICIPRIDNRQSVTLKKNVARGLLSLSLALEN